MASEHTPGFVPEPPSAQVIISSVDMEKIERWIAFFKGMSERVHIVRPNDDRFDQFYSVAEENLRKRKIIENHCTIVGWPKESEIAFALAIDIAHAGSLVPKFDIEDSYFFCFGKKAFGVTYFEWDGDGDAGHYPTTYSLKGYSEGALSWEYITKIITDRVKDLEDRVPDPPQVSPA